MKIKIRGNLIKLAPWSKIAREVINEDKEKR